MRRGLGPAAVAAAIVAALLAAGGSAWLASYSWSQVAGYKSPYVRASLPASAETSAATGRVVLVIVDGLRSDVSRQMRAFETLRQHGSDLTLTASQPALSYPDWTTILSGAPQRISGVTTNGFDRRVPVETLLDTAKASGRRTVVVGPSKMGTLYGAGHADAHYFRDFKKGQYLSTDLVLHAIGLTNAIRPEFVLVHLPDVDEAGHEHGGASQQYLKAAQRVDTDISVLVNSLQDGVTTFVFVSDHGHIAEGGHGGWEPEVIEVPAIVTGAGAALWKGTGRLEDLAPTVAVIAGLPVPRDSFGRVLTPVLAMPQADGQAAAHEERARFLGQVLDVVAPADAPASVSREQKLAKMNDEQMTASVGTADATRLDAGRDSRLALALGLAAVALLAAAAVGALSWRALAASLAGAAAYYAVYDGLYFGVHRLAWSLSSINSEDRMAAFFATRLAEAAVAGLAAAAVAGIVYPLLRGQPKGAYGRYRSGWLSLGPATILVVQATLAVQVAYYLWRWGAAVSWILPDLRLGFRYDLDLLQVVALGAAALLAPVVTLLVGRYHPRVARPHEAASSDLL